MQSGQDTIDSIICIYNCISKGFKHKFSWNINTTEEKNLNKVNLEWIDNNWEFRIQLNSNHTDSICI